MDKATPLSAAQRAVAEAFFALDVSKDFLLSGGAALVALGLSGRPTEDLDVSAVRHVRAFVMQQRRS